MSPKYISLMTVLSMLATVPTAEARRGGASATSSQTQPTGERMERFKQALAKLDLSVDQKSQIRQIMTTAVSNVTTQKTTPTVSGKSRGSALLRKIMNVLTEPQKTNLKQILKSERSSSTKK